MNAKILRRIGALLLVATAAAAQQQAAPTVPQPKIYAISPSGGKAGTVVDVRITSGTDLDGVQKLLFSHPGIAAKPLMEEAGRLYPQGRAIDGKFKVSVAADVPPGIYEVRAAGYFGATNARRFAVSGRDEAAEKEPNNDAATAQEPPLGSVVTGTCEAQNYDFYKIAAKKGAAYLNLVRACEATIARNVTGNLFERHLRPVFIGV